MKEFQYGNTKVIIHSPLTEMTKEQQKEWFQKEWTNENPLLNSIMEAAMKCHNN